VRRIFDTLDDLAWVGCYFNNLNTTWPVKPYKLYDPEKFTLTPKESYKKELAELRKKEIESLEKEKENLDKRIKELKSS
jgi:hypothetical protein